jgi:hypothetical protein
MNMALHAIRTRLSLVVLLDAVMLGALTLGQACLHGNPPRWPGVNEEVFAAGLKCDGTTDDTDVLASTLKRASESGAQVLNIAAGTCLLHGGTNIPRNIWIKGAGAAKTTLKLISGSNTYLLGLNSNDTITDLTLDGNKLGPNAGGNILGAGGTALAHVVLTRNIFLNASGCAVGFFLPGSPRPLTSDILIDQNRFFHNGSAVDNGGTQSGFNGDICAPATVRLRVTNNHADGGAGDFVVLGTGGNATGVGDITIDHNEVSSGLGFAVALGGGGPGEAGGRGATIQNNTFSMADSIENIIDVAYWHDVTLTRNHITTGYTGAGIGDGPPAFGVTATDNLVQGLGSYVSSLSAASIASAGQTVYTGVFSPPLRAGYTVTISGFRKEGNNCTPSALTPCTVVSGTTTSVVVNNAKGEAEIQAAHLKLNNSNNWGIALGSSRVIIARNTIANMGSAGILIDVGDGRNATDSIHDNLIRDNSVKNCGQADNVPGTTAGIALYVSPSGSNTMSGIVIRGNRVFNEGIPTQGYGLAIGSPGSRKTGFSDIRVEGNDFRGNMRGGIQDGAPGAPGVSILKNLGGNDPR